MNYRNTIWKGLLAAMMLAVMVSSAFAVTKDQANVLIDKISRGVELTGAERQQVQDFKAETGENLLSYRPQERPRPPHNPLDEYAYSEIEYEWVDILSVATPSGINADDQNLGPFNIGFSFPFFGQNYTQFRICSNGFMTFGSTSTAWTNGAIPSAVEPNGAIYPFWDDMDMAEATGDGPDSIYYHYDAENERLIVTWDTIPHFSNLANETYTYQVILTPDGHIQFNYRNITMGTIGNTSCTVGIEGPAGVEALQVCFDGNGWLPTSGTSIVIGELDGVPNPPANLNGSPSGTSVTLTWDDPTTDTNGNPLTPDVIEIFQNGTEIGSVAAGVETYTVNGLAAGTYTFGVRAVAGEFASNMTSVVVVVGLPSYFADFEADDGDLVADLGWEWGSPAGYGPGTAHSGDNCWGTILTADYEGAACYNLDIDQQLTISSDEASLEFYAWYATEDGWDGFVIMVSVDEGATWEVVNDVAPGYDGTINGLTGCFEDINAWNGFNGSWQNYIVNLGAYNGTTPIIRFAFTSDAIINDAGVYIDDVILWGFGEPEFAPVSGTVTLDGGAGVVTNVAVRANGIGNPQTNPAGNGTYTLASVLTGNRRITGTLAGYHTAEQNIVLETGGATGVNLTLVRLDPPIPTGLTASEPTEAGQITLNWNASTDPLVDDYPVYWRLRGNPDWMLAGAPTTNTLTTTLPGSGIWQIAVAARDNGASTPIESDVSAFVEVLFGSLPVGVIGASGNYDDRIRVSWLDPTISEGSEIFYDDGTSETWFRVNTPNGQADYFTVRMTPPDDATYPLLIWAANIMMERSDPLPWVALCPPNGANAGADLDNPLYEWTDIGADSTPGWLYAETDGSVFLTEPGDFYIVIQFPPGGTGPGCGSDNSAPDNRSYWTNSYPTWNLWTANDWIMRAWVGGPPPAGLASATEQDIELYAIDGAGGYAVDRIPSRTTITLPALDESALKTGKGAAARALSNSTPAFVDPLDQWFAPYFRAPQVAMRDRRPGHSLDELVSFNIYRDGSLIGNVPATEHSYFDLNRIENTPYDYYVTGLYVPEGESGPSPTVTAMCNMPPAAPEGLTATPSGTTDMVLQWTIPTTNADGTPLVDLTGYNVYRSGELIGTTAPGVTTLTNTPPLPNFYYVWTVTAFDEVPNESAPSAGVIAAVVSPWEEFDYEWVDITGDGTVIVNADDINSGLMPLPWDFEFYGNTYSDFSVCSNGFLSFTSTSNSLGNGAIPSTVEPNTAIYPFWDDLNPGAGGDVYMLNDVANDRLIVSWVDVPHFGNTNLYTFQVILEPPTTIILQYQSMSDVSSGTIGVENQGGTEAIMMWNNGVPGFEWSPDNESAIAFFAPEPTFGPLSGHVTLDGGAGVVTNVQVRASGRGAPTTNPDGSGNFSFAAVATGNRTVTGTLAGYHTTVVPVVGHDEGGTTGVEVTMVRLDPPGPTNVTASVNNETGLATITWTASTDPLVDVYPVYRRLATEQNWTLQGTPAASPFTQTLTVPGIYQYAVAARDNGVSTPVESDPVAAPGNVLYGALPVTNISANGNFDDRIALSWLEPGVLEGTEISYDDGTSETWFRVNTPNGPADYFTVRMSPPDDATYPLMLYAANIYMEREDPLPFVALCPPNGANNGADIDNPFYTWEDIGADGAPGWLYAETDGSVLLDEEGDFYIVIQFPPGGTGPGCGSDNSDPDDRSYWTNAYPNWNLWTANDWMMRAWVGGPPPEGGLLINPDGVRLDLESVGEPTGYAADRVASRQIVRPELEDTKDAKAARVALAQYENQFTFANTLDQWFAPYSRAPEVQPASRRVPRSLDDIISYRVYRQGTGQIAQVNYPTSNYTDLNRIENTPYTYWVTAVYDNGVESPESPHVTRSCNMAPNAPSGLVANPLGTSQMFLAWAAPTTNADGTPLVDLQGFRVYRDGVQIAALAVGELTYTDTPPDNQTYYTWTVTAIDEVPNVSAPSNSVVGAVVSPWEQVDYEWTDISGVGTPLALTDDSNTGLLALPWDFEFYGQTYSQISVCSNGWLSFTSTSNSLGNGAIPNAAEPNAAIYPFWDDLNPGAGGTVYWHEDNANDRLIVAWVDVPHFGNNNLYTFEVILEPPTGIYFYYNFISDASSATAGVENADGTDAIMLWNNGAGPLAPSNQTGVGFWAGPSGEINGIVREFGSNNPIAGAEVWIEELGEFALTDAQGNYAHSVEPGTYTVRAHKLGYCDGISENVVVDDGGATTRTFSLRQPNAIFSASSLNIFATVGENGAAGMEITNPTQGAISCDVEYTISSDEDWLVANPASGEVPVNGSVFITVTANVAAFPVGEYTANLLIDHNDTGSPYEVPVTVVVSVDADDAPVLPTEFALNPSYPNPFNPSTTLSFDVPNESRVELAVFNVRGQEVARPLDATVQAGRHSVTFNADNLPTGMYLVKMTAQNFTSVQKIVLLK
ncbi:MAG: carboxypeptidase regulatory-like domain-containing protein [Calditrichaeota bacterium]|nr:carboxypeptidase regulatory-like domain-containing protein [Calditrichota bacterium]